MTIQRCTWANGNPLMEEYHDKEWGTPTHSDKKLFEFLILESAQAGLSWLTILKRREGYRRAFSTFDPKKVAEFTQKDVEKLLKDETIIRNRAKIEAAINNARQFLKIQEEFGSFDAYAWSFVDNKPVRHTIKNESDYPEIIDETKSLSKDLKKRSFKFLGPTTLYAFMQAVGMIDDHMVDCFKRSKVS